MKSNVFCISESLNFVKLFEYLYSIIGLMLGTLISFQVVIGDLAPALISSAFGIEVSLFQLTNLLFGKICCNCICNVRCSYSVLFGG